MQGDFVGEIRCLVSRAVVECVGEVAFDVDGALGGPAVGAQGDLHMEEGVEATAAESGVCVFAGVHEVEGSENAVHLGIQHQLFIYGDSLLDVIRI